MNILISSHSFYPNVGGIEVVSSTLAHEFVNQGHKVKIITQTVATAPESFPFEVIRQPKKYQLFKLVSWCNVFFHNNISLQTLWPLLLLHKPWVVAHHTWIARTDGSLGWQDYVKYFLIRFATSISISQVIADRLSTPSAIIGNPYDDDLFYGMPEIPRKKELVFLGRLVSDKGVGLLITALGQLKKNYNLTPDLTIIGTGTEEKPLHDLTKDLDVSNQVDFIGTRIGPELVQLLNAHQVMVVPSLWLEPFGIVALEGIACGCVIVGSEGGGLKEAIGACGVTFPNGDIQTLTQKLADLLLNPNYLATYRARANSHLSHYKKTAVAKAYLQVFEDAIK
ncbi:glycosyltransferase family 4 protein [Chlorogloea sp. CCALA 695]|uniref:glycosyltransferase family 4 protein n=1 Tax=Chlorogloea sp. CCALA 695 TaxID=2107693 RepID=UPI000D06C136|nr:glycosyltransferase family 4 protein [Chlorogloea sp. CCALA 695]PSB29482.1 glycosyl transferase family 1 [Chlorogloea sp. CCALA 695]